MTQRACIELLQWAMPRLGLRFRGFARNTGQVCKRISRRIRELGLEDFGAYRQRLEQDPEEWTVLDALCRVTISRFYRDQEVWEALRTAVLPTLAQSALSRGDPLRCWSAGCASGEEAWTLGLLLQLEVAPGLPGLRWEILATDADPALIERARRGCYRSSILREAPPTWAERAFDRRGDEMCLRPEYRQHVSFEVADLRDPVPEGPFDLLLCRNVVFTYLDREVQRRVLASFRARMREGGVLVIGSEESLPSDAEAQFGLERCEALPIYRFSTTSM